MAKRKLTIKEQIDYMRDDCGIKFEICSEDQAERFLRNSNYYFKVKAYAKDFGKDKITGKYINLDFAYLIELSTLDFLLRKEIINLALNVEHFLKVGFITHLSDNENEDGYDIVKRYFEVSKRDIRQEITDKGKTSYCKELIEKMQNDGWAAWNIIEVLSLGNFIDLYGIYCTNNNWNNRICNLLIPAKSIRNAAAHNNCLLNSLYKPYTFPYRTDTDKGIETTKQVESYVRKIPALKKSKSINKLDNPVIHDFVTLLYLFDKVVTSDETKSRSYTALHDLFENRMRRHSDYFVKNEQILSSYEFVRKIVDFLYNKM